MNALCEYIIFKEMPLKCNIDGLRRELNIALDLMGEEERKNLSTKANMLNIQWLELVKKNA